MHSRIPFEQLWGLLQRTMASPIVIRNWTQAGGYLGEDFVAQHRGTHVVCVLRSERRIKVPKGDFQAVYRLWSAYTRGTVLRKDIVAVTFRSKYIISILHQVFGKELRDSRSEPEFSQVKNPEQSLQAALVTAVRSLLKQSGADFILLEEFGLDIAAFIQQGSRDYVRMIEVKAFVGSRPGAVGIGNNRGRGSQVDLLAHPLEGLRIVDWSIRWVLGMGTLPRGSARYAVFTSAQAKKAVMGDGAARGKQNNLRVSDFEDELVTWDSLLTSLAEFLIG